MPGGTAHSDQLDGERAHRQSDRDQRCLGTEDETETQRRQRCRQDAHQVDRPNVSHRDSLERRVPAVPREANGCRNEKACQRRHEDDVPPCRLVPSCFPGQVLPDEMDEVVDRGLEEHGRERDRHAEQRREDECLHIGAALDLGGGCSRVGCVAHGRDPFRSPGRRGARNGHRSAELAARRRPA